MRVENSSVNSIFEQYIKTNILEYGIVHGDDNWHHMGTSSPYHRLYYVEKGSVYVNNNGKKHVISTGELFLLRNNTLMDYYAEFDFKKFYIHFQYPLYGGLDLLDGYEDIIKISDSDNIIEQLTRIKVDNSIMDYAILQSVLYSVLEQTLHYLNNEHMSILHNNKYEQLIKTIEDRMDVRFTVDEMAKQCSQSVSDFTRKFKKSTGLSPKTFLHNIILNRAKVILATTDMTIKEIAYLLGYKDCLYFSRFFKKQVGMSPTAYREGQNRYHSLF